MKFKRLSSVFLALCVFFSLAIPAAGAAPAVRTGPYPAEALPLPPQINSETYVVMDAQSGQVLVARGADKRMYPASITKIVTVALALDAHGMEETFTMSDEAVFSVRRDSTHIALTPGEVVSVEQMANAAMIQSANDAANGLAEYTGGTLDGFVDMMNAKAAGVGAGSTHFANANGLYDPAHYTTARDMALLTRWALGVPHFRQVFGATDYQMGPTNLQPSPRNFETSHCMFVYSAYEYEGASGGKLGWTPESNHTIVTVAQRGGMELICVAMNTKTKWEKFKDSVALFDYCFDNFERLVFTPADLALPQEVPLYSGGEPAGSVRLSLPQGEVALDVPKGTGRAALRVQADIPARFEAAQAAPVGAGEEGDAAGQFATVAQAAGGGAEPAGAGGAAPAENALLGEAPQLSFYSGETPLLFVPVQTAVVAPPPAPPADTPAGAAGPGGLPLQWWAAMGAAAALLLALVAHRVRVYRRRLRRRRLRNRRLGRVPDYR